MTDLERLAPHGCANPSPSFFTPDLGLTADPRVFKEKHLKLFLSSGEKSMNAIGWGMAERGSSLKCHDRVDIAYSIEADTYRGGWQLVLEDFREAAPD